MIFLVAICARFSSLHVIVSFVFNPPNNKAVMDGFLDEEIGSEKLSEMLSYIASYWQSRDSNSPFAISCLL